MQSATLYKRLGALCAVAFAALCLAGCSTDENPITPEKMQQIRQKEQSERQNFNPSMTPPPRPGSPAAPGK